MREQLRGIMTDIETIAREAKMVAFNARIVAARSGQAGKEFSVVAGVLSNITGEIDHWSEALSGAAA
jgi:methyl-accepting chemotaxis protein